MNLCAISCHYERPEMAALLIDSCKHYRVPLHFCEAKELNGRWSVDLRVSKMRAVLDHLDWLAGYTHLIWIDSFDAFVQADVEMIVYRWHLLGCPPMVFSGEKNCWPDDSLAHKYSVVGSSWKYINAGTWMAQVGYLREALKRLLFVHYDNNDQLIWTKGFLNGYLPGAVIDTERRIFQTMWGTDRSEVGDPCVVHYNGGDESKYAIARAHYESVKR